MILGLHYVGHREGHSICVGVGHRSVFLAIGKSRLHEEQVASQVLQHDGGVIQLTGSFENEGAAPQVVATIVDTEPAGDVTVEVDGAPLALEKIGITSSTW